MSSPSSVDFLNGKVLLVDKPYEWTSFNVVNKLRYALKKKLNVKKIKVGHAGTLDPLATGLLVICVGKMTKQIDSFMNTEKEYTGTIFLGASTPSYDLETDIDKTYPTNHIDSQLILETTTKFLGEIEQTPPIFSAKKIDGKRAYELARKGEKVEMKKNLVTIHDFEITNINLPEVEFKIKCSKGTYIRSIAHDFGQELNSGGHLTSLRRTRSGEHHIDDAKNIEEIVKHIESAT